MARLSKRQKNFGMAKAVKKSPAQISNSGKSSKKQQNTKNSQSNRQQSTNKRSKKSNPIPKLRSAQNIQKRETAQKFNNASSRRSAPKKNVSRKKTANSKAESETAEKINCGQKNNNNSDASRKVNKEKNFKRTNISSGDTSPSIFDKTSISVYQALEYCHNSDSTAESSNSLVAALNGIVIVSAEHGQQSPDLFGTDTMEQHKCDSVEKVSVGVQCNLTMETQTDAQVGTDAMENRIITIDVGIQTSPLPNETWQLESSFLYGSRHNEFGSFDQQFIESDDSYGSYESDSSYDHCLDNFDCLEHLDDTGNNLQQNVQNFNVIGHNASKMDRIEPVIDASPPKNQVYKNNRFHSPESL